MKKIFAIMSMITGLISCSKNVDLQQPESTNATKALSFETPSNKCNPTSISLVLPGIPHCSFFRDDELTLSNITYNERNNPTSAKSKNGKYRYLFQYDEKSNLITFLSFEGNELTASRKYTFKHSQNYGNSNSGTVWIDYYSLEPNGSYKFIESTSQRFDKLLRLEGWGRITAGDKTTVYNFAYGPDNNVSNVMIGTKYYNTRVRFVFENYDAKPNIGNINRVWQILSCNTNKNNPRKATWVTDYFSMPLVYAYSYGTNSYPFEVKYNNTNNVIAGYPCNVKPPVLNLP